MSTVLQLVKRVSMLAAICAAAKMCAETPKFTPQDGFCFHSSGVNLPIGKFVLIRRNKEIGSLRILTVTPDDTSKQSGTEWLGNVQYESVFSKDGSSLKSATAIHRFGTLIFKPLRCFGPHCWQGGEHKAHVGSLNLWAYWPDGFFMTSVDFWHGVNDDTGLQFAGTNASNIADLDANDPRLTWFGYDNNRDIPCPVSVPPIKQHEK